MGGTGVRVWRAPVGAGGGAGEEREAERHRQAKDNTVCVQEDRKDMPRPRALQN